jgi:hypothetical protein
MANFHLVHISVIIHVYILIHNSIYGMVHLTMDTNDFFSHSFLSKLCKCLYRNIGVQSIAQKKGKPFDTNHLQWILTSIDYHVYKLGGRKPP